MRQVLLPTAPFRFNVLVNSYLRGRRGGCRWSRPLTTVVPWFSFSTKSHPFAAQGQQLHRLDKLNCDVIKCFGIESQFLQRFIEPQIPSIHRGFNLNAKYLTKPRWYSTSSSFSYPPPERKRLISLLLRILKLICLVTGIGVWGVLILLYVMVDELKFEKSDKMEVSTLEPLSLIRNLKFLGIIEDDQNIDMEAILKSHSDEVTKMEISERLHAFQDVWQKLKDEEGLQLSLGKPVEICGYNCSTEKEDSWHISNEDKKNKWRAKCYIEGSDGTAILKVLFERHHTDSEWVATKVHLEKVTESGEVICNVSGTLPNGLKNFTRLSDVT